MKKILLALMMMVSVSFALCPQTVVYNGATYDNYGANGFTYITKDKSPYPADFSIIGDLLFYWYHSSDDSWSSSVRYCKYLLTSATCPSGQTMNSDRQCVPKDDPLECDPTKGTFTNLDGQCTDCSSFLASDLKSMANCACGATDSTYVPSSVTPQVPVTQGNDVLTQTPIKCSDGSSKNVYYNKTSAADTNNTTPSDNNSTSPTDNNNTTPNDNNGTQDGNGTKPDDGNGTKDGKDYTKYLETIVEKLKRIDDDTDNLSGINSGINGDYPVKPDTNTIPDDTSGGNFNTYQETWGNIVDSFNAVSNKVDDAKGLFGNGLGSGVKRSAEVVSF